MVSSINGHIKPPDGAVFIRADVRQGWFVVKFSVEERQVEIFYNQDGREVFRVDQKPKWWERIWNANSIYPA